MWDNLILQRVNALITWWHFLSVSKEHDCWRPAIKKQQSWYMTFYIRTIQQIHKVFKVNVKMSRCWYSGTEWPACCFWSLRELSQISFNGLSHTRDSSRRAGACLFPPRFAFQHVITALRRWRGWGRAMFRAPRSLPFRDACLLEGFFYRKAAGRWLGKLRGKVSGSLRWIPFCLFLY